MGVNEGELLQVGGIEGDWGVWGIGAGGSGYPQWVLWGLLMGFELLVLALHGKPPPSTE